MVRRALMACFVVASGTVGIAQVTLWKPPARSIAVQPHANIVCGMRIFRADPTIDPKIARTAPEGVFTLRTLQPPVCRDTFPITQLKQRLPQFLGPKR